MKQKLFLALLIVMFFVLSATTLFAQSRLLSNDDIKVSLQNDVGGVAVVNTDVIVRVVDIQTGQLEQITSATADFIQFSPDGLTVTERTLVLRVDGLENPILVNTSGEIDVNPALNLYRVWDYTYTVLAGTQNSVVNRKVKVSANHTNGTDIRWSTTDFTVNNVIQDISSANVITEVITNPSPSNPDMAIIGSTVEIRVLKTEIDNPNNDDSAPTVTYRHADFSSFGGPNNVELVEYPSDVDYYHATYTVQEGSINGNAHGFVIVKYDDANPNPAQTNTNNTTPILVNNVRPTEGLLSNLQMAINGINDETVMRLGDFIRVKGSIENVQPNNKVDKIVIDWGLTFGGGVTTQEVQAQIVPGSDPESRIFSVDFTPPAGLVDINGISVEYLNPLVIYITDLISTVGNHATANPTVSGTPGWDVRIDKNSAGTGVEVFADMTPPSLAGARDLYYDIANDHLRFSPNTADVDSYTTTPNTFDIYLTLPNWGTESYRFTLRFVNENRSSLFKTFEYGDSEITVVTTDADGELFVSWDGTADNDVPVYDPAVPNTTIGITLWAIEDEVGNAAELTYATSVEYTVANGHNDISDGEVYLNRLHVVVDNQPVTQTTAQRLKPTDPDFITFSAADPIVIKRFINAEDGHPFNETHIVMPKNYIELNSRVNRVFEVNTVPQRDETATWWAILENDDSSIKQYWDVNTTAWVDYTAFDHLTNAIDVGFTPGATLSNIISFNWDLENTDANLTNYPAGNYKIYAYYMDNAGNIVKDGNEVFVTIENVFYQIPVITNVQITSTHIIDGAGLPTQTGGFDPVFYLDGFALDGDNVEYQYYTTSDEIEITVTLNNWENLVEDADGHTLELDLSVLGLGVINVNKSQISNTAFTYVHTIDVATLADALADYEEYELKYNVPAKQDYQFSIGGLTNNIRVRVFDKEETYGETGVYAGNDSDFFNIRIPNVPTWPAADGEYAADLRATPNVFSPGNPNNAYDALTNPAFDGEIDETQFAFNYTDEEYAINYELSFQRLGGDTLLVTNGDFAAHTSGTVTFPATPFDGIVDANPITNANPTLAGDLVEDFNLILNITVAPAGIFLDPGYEEYIPVLYDNSETPYIVTVDNQNPSLVDGDGSTVNITDRHITIPGYETEVPVLTNTINEIEFTVHTSEFLTADFVPGAYDPAVSDGGLWSILLVGEDGAVLNSGAATVEITKIVGSDDDGNEVEAERLFKTFAITAQISGVNDFDYPNAKLVVRLPNDPAGNPGRRNYPNNYPYNAHNEWNDSSEYFINVHILKHKPNIAGISFTYKDVMGTLDDDESTIDPPAFVTNDPADLEFVLVAGIEGGAYRAIETNWVADLSPLMGNGEGDVNLTLEPVDQLMGGTYELVWESDYVTDPANPIVFNIDPAIAATWEHGDELVLNVYVVTGEDGDTYHEVIRSITVTVDLEAPVITNNTIETMTIPAGPSGGFNVVFDISDDDSGVDWDYYDDIEDLVADDDRYAISVPVTPSAIAVNDGAGTVTFTFTESDFADYTHFTVTLLTQDKMDNEGEGTIFVNVDPLPVISNVVINESADFFGPNEDVVVEWTVSDPQRVNALTVTLTMPGQP
nr:hypothetical protein [Candidatus Cloacimonadota bacterium]